MTAVTDQDHTDHTEPMGRTGRTERTGRTGRMEHDGNARVEPIERAADGRTGVDDAGGIKGAGGTDTAVETTVREPYARVADFAETYAETYEDAGHVDRVDNVAYEEDEGEDERGEARGRGGPAGAPPFRRPAPAAAPPCPRRTHCPHRPCRAFAPRPRRRCRSRGGTAGRVGENSRAGGAVG
ncbi:hypothetical protein ACQ4WX_18945 [Streptomyces lasalocidi]